MTASNPPNVTPALLRQLIRLDERTGKLFWLARKFPSSWNTRLAGKEAFLADNGNGYKVGTIFNKKYYAHRVAWAVAHGEWPNGHIDHINHDRSDNRIANLRVVTHAENSKNQSLRSSNTSGVTGVSFAKAKSKWIASICRNGKQVSLGYFDNLADASHARQLAARNAGYHENHGRIEG
jgi:HNH endonuclease/AP2 domain